MFTRLLCENLKTPLGVGTPKPRVSWNLSPKSPVLQQRAYRLVVAEEGIPLKQGRNPERGYFDSGRVESSQCLHVQVGLPLKSATRYFWKVKVFGENGRETRWSAQQWFETAYLSDGEWKPSWIGRLRRDPEDRRPTFLRRQFTIRKKVRQARLAISALGLGHPECNGRPVGRDLLAPGWTNYHKRNQYLIHDIGPFLNEGENCLGVILGDGWYSGHLLFGYDRNFYGKHPAAAVRLEIEYADGDRDIIRSDDQWTMITGPYLMSDIYDGETYDARLEKKEWSTPGYRARGWKAVDSIDGPKASLEAKLCPPVRTTKTIYPKTYWQHSGDTWTYDFEQNMVGVVRIRLPKAKRGHRVRLKFAEMLHPEGTPYDNLRTARCMDEYIYSGKEENGFEYVPLFTYHGFRYVQIIDYPGTPEGDILEGLVQHTDLPETGKLRTSHKLLNRLVENILWSQRGNFIEVPTDCPQRNERLGWTGDAQVFIPAACYLMDLYPFFHKWLRDLRDDQKRNGAYPDVAPDVLSDFRIRQKAGPRWGSAAWGDAGVICPWVLYERYGDVRILKENYEAMLKWIEYCRNSSDGLIRHETNYGDWLDPTVINPGEARTSNRLLGTACFARSTELVARCAGILGKKNDAKRLWELWHSIRRAFAGEYVTPNGCLVSDTQSGYLLALAFNLLDGEQESIALKRLLHLFAKRNYRISTGFVGTPLACEVLSRFGLADIAYKVLLQEEYPGWMYPVKNGATTMWERWDSWTPENGFHPQDMNSFNHYAYGSVGDWLFRWAAGICPRIDYPAFEKFELKPQPDDSLKWLRAQFNSPYGRIKSSWKWTGKRGSIEYRFTVPPNTEATAVLPKRGKKMKIKRNGRSVRGVETERGYEFALEPGECSFSQR